MENKINKNELLEFIAEAHRNTYAAPKEIKSKHKCQNPILQGHKDYHYKKGDWEYHDSYAGSSWAPGREVVFLRGKPVWCMSYQGKPNEDYSDGFFQNEAFPFLKKALRNMEDSMPFRGPQEFEKGDFRYSFQIDGDYSYFKGREVIQHKGVEVFFQDVMGELIK